MNEIALITIVTLLIIVLIQQVLLNKSDENIIVLNELNNDLQEVNEDLQYTIGSLKDDIFNLQEQGGLFNEN